MKKSDKMYCGIAMLIVGIVLITITTFGPSHTEQVSCYDEYYNEMIDQVCLDEVYEYRGLSAIGGLLASIGFIVSIYSILYPSFE